MSELLFLHVGQCGCQVGSRLWKLFGKEHQINSDGILLLQGVVADDHLNSLTKQQQDNSSSTSSTFNISSLYDESLREENKLKARCLFIDSDPMVIHQVKNDKNLTKLLKDENLIKGQEDCASNFGRGKYSVGRDYLRYIRERVRKMVEACDSPGGFVMTHSIEGGTGSGYSSFISELLNDNYPQLTKSAFTVFPSENFKSVVVEPYNSVLGLADLRNNMTNIFNLENESMYDICKNYGVKTPHYSDVNDVISQTISTYTQPARFYNSSCSVLSPYKRMNIISSTFTKVDNTNSEINATDLFSHSCRMSSTNHLSGSSILMNISLRGNFSLNHINTFSNQLKEWNTPKINSNSLQFEIFTNRAENISESSLSFSDFIHVSNNSSSIINPMEQLKSRFNRLYNKRSFVHWFVGEGMEEGEFWEAIEVVQQVIDDYSNIQNGIIDSKLVQNTRK